MAPNIFDICNNAITVGVGFASVGFAGRRYTKK